MTTPFLNLTEAAGKVAALSTAVRLGLLDRIDREPDSPAELARACGATERGIRAVMAVLTESGFTEQLSDGRYRPVLAGLAALHPLIPLWDQLPDAVRTGIPVYESSTCGETYPPPMPDLAGLWGDATGKAAETLPKADRVLDFGAGAVPWTIAHSTLNPDSLITAIDLPEVIPATRRTVSRAGLTDRFKYIPGDLSSTPLESCAYGLIVLAQVCSLFDQLSGARLIKRLVPALAPNGVLAIIDTLAGSSGSALHALSLYLRTSEDAVHQPTTYQEWLADTGLTRITTANLPSQLAITVAMGEKT